MRLFLCTVVNPQHHTKVCDNVYISANIYDVPSQCPSHTDIFILTVSLTTLPNLKGIYLQHICFYVVKLNMK